jgi:hypothetical protein
MYERTRTHTPGHSTTHTLTSFARQTFMRQTITVVSTGTGIHDGACGLGMTGTDRWLKDVDSRWTFRCEGSHETQTSYSGFAVFVQKLLATHAGPHD